MDLLALLCFVVAGVLFALDGFGHRRGTGHPAYFLAAGLFFLTVALALTHSAKF